MFAWIRRKPRRMGLMFALFPSSQCGIWCSLQCRRNVNLNTETHSWNHPAACATSMFIPRSQCDLCVCPRKKPEIFCFLLKKSGFIFQELLWCSQALPSIKVCAILRAQRQLSKIIPLKWQGAIVQTVLFVCNSVKSLFQDVHGRNMATVQQAPVCSCTPCCCSI